MIVDIVKVFIPAVLSFAIGIGITPLLTHYLYARELWKKRAGKVGLDGRETTLFNRLHAERETGTPRFGGVVIWFSTVASAAVIFALARLVPSEWLPRLDFLTRSQTWIPLAVLLLGAGIGFIDDVFEVRGMGGYPSGGLSLKKRLALVGFVGALVGGWFFYKLSVTAVGIPFLGPVEVGIFIVPLFALASVAVYSGGIIDGIDGLAGGIFAIIFAAYGAIAFFQNQIGLSAFCAALLGGILAFLWFNVPPARFYMSETGSMSLTLTLAVVAFMTDVLGDGEGLALLLIVAFPLFITSFSVIIQMLSKKYFGRKIFMIAPLHHHFEAKGWPPYKVVMRYWILGAVFGIAGLIVALAG